MAASFFPFSFSTNRYLWLVVFIFGGVGAAHHLTNVMMLVYFPGGVWYIGVALTVAFGTAAVVVALKVRQRWWWYLVVPVAVAGALSTGGQPYWFESTDFPFFVYLE